MTYTQTELEAWLLVQVGDNETHRHLIDMAIAFRRVYVGRGGLYEAGRHDAGNMVLRVLATAYADRPGYDKRWRPW